MDSIVVVVNPLPNIIISGNTEICQGEGTTLTASGANTYLWDNGVTHASMTTFNEGTYRVIGTDTTNGCSTTESVTIVMNYPVFEEWSATACDSYPWDGRTYTSSGDYVWTGQTANGCDSIVTLHLTINTSVTHEITEVVSGSYEWNGNVYTESGDYTWVGQTAAGCDSTVVLHLTISTGIAEGSEEVAIKVWPNPAHHVCNVTCHLDNAALHLFDAMGRCVLSRKVVEEVTPLDMSTLMPGVYMLHIVADEKVMSVTKIIKQ